ncbi:MAG: transketolase C-terminal domain-containing protein [Candidatus Magasanikbacteria bacterium]
MRNTVINNIFEEAKKNPNIILLIGDLGYSVVENFQRELPKQFINVGIAEQNMIGLAAGLALSGKKVFVYSIVPFVTLRCLEQIKVDVCYQNLDVTIIGVGAGYTYGSAGVTHHAIEDIAVMQSLPNMRIVVPADAIQSAQLISQIVSSAGPCYLRLSKGGDPSLSWLHEEPAKLGVSSIIKSGNDVMLLCIGTIVNSAYIAVQQLINEGIDIGLIYFNTIKPLDRGRLLKLANQSNFIITLEEGNIIGGFGTTVGAELCELGFKGRFKRLGVPDLYYSVVGSQEFMRSQAGLSVENIIKTIKSALRR